MNPALFKTLRVVCEESRFYFSWVLRECGAGTQTVKSLWQLSETLELSRRTLNGALKGSDTPWDRFLPKATPDLPTYLSGRAMVRLRRPGRFRRFWAQLLWIVPQPHRRAFKTWLQQEAIKLADPSFTLVEPVRMRVE